MERSSLVDRPARPGAGSDWIKSSLRFSNVNFVEVANLADGQMGIRHSKDTTGPVLRFTSDEWHAFLGMHNREFEIFGRR